ncbi:MAG: hypothetical protein COB09_18230 [Thalassobium sp.]|nr:MAG: hypothetical protein COB09_18230 [Thalassobium sp.]
MKKPSVRALTAALLLSGTALAAQAEDKVCLYEHAEYQGAEWCYGVGDNSWIGSSRNDKVSSIKLYGNSYIEIFEHSNYGGKHSRVMANTYKMGNMNDGISSFKVRNRNSNDFSCLFEHPGFRGTPHCLQADEGESDLNNVLLGRNKASSLLVAGKANVEIFNYPGFNYSKENRILTRSTSNLEERPASWTEDNIDSFRVTSRAPTAQEAAIDITEAAGYRSPIRETNALASHNAFNSTAYFGGQLIPGPNHRRALIEQLQLGVRFFELDVSKGGSYTKVCHSVDCGTTFTTTLRRMLGEVDSWLKGADANDVVFFFLQDDINGDSAGYQQLQRDVEWMGDIVYTAGSCQTIPYDLTFEQIRQQGKRVFIYKDDGSTGCDIAQSVAVNFEQNKGVSGLNVYENHFNSSRYVRSQECINYFCNDNVSAAEALTGLQNGINAFGLDMLEEGDIDGNGARLNNQLWAVGPEGAASAYSNGKVARFHASGNRFMSVAGDSSLNYACRNSSGQWVITQAMGNAANGTAACAAEYPGYAYTTPASAYEARLLRDAITSGSDVHVNFAVSNGQWLPDRW